MIRPHIIWFLLWTVLLAACSNTRFLTEDEVLYTGRKEMVVKAAEEGVNTSRVKPQVRSVTSYRMNNALFGRRILPPVGLWVHNYWEPEEGRKIRNWMYRSMHAPPVLISEVKPGLRAQKIESDLFDQGHFHSRAWSVVDTSRRNPKKAMVSYHVELGRPFRYQDIRMESSLTSLDTLMEMKPFLQRIRSGDPYNLQMLTAARTELARALQDRGYFYFSPEYIKLHADTTVGDHLLNLTVSRQEGLPEEVITRYRIDDIRVDISHFRDSVNMPVDSMVYGNLMIFSTGDYLRPEVLQKAVLLEKGALYSYRSYQQTLSRLNNMGIFNSARISYGISPEDSLKNLVDVRIHLVLADNVSLELEADLVMKSTDYIGPLISANLSNGNSFRGGERIHFGLNGGFEMQWGSGNEAQLGTFSYELGAEFGLALPRLIVPGPKKRIQQIARQQTSINQSFNLLNRTAFYQMFSIRTDLNYSWGPHPEMTHSFSPAYLNSISLLATTAAFDSVINDNIYIRKSFEEQFIIGARYNFIYDNSPRSQARNFYFNGGVSTSGNLIDGLKHLGGPPSERPIDFLGSIYSQHIKFTADLRYYINGFNHRLVTRLYTGIGIPYLNSEVLPYVEQFFSGGAYSVRGFLARTVGPGTFQETDNTYIDQSGDVKLEANLEYRFDMSPIIKGALFTDAGNIWLVNEDESRPGSRFDIRKFYQQLAVGAGFGLRFDFTFFVLRTDIGLPLRTPYLQDDSHWQPGTGNLFSKAKFYLAIGYPF